MVDSPVHVPPPPLDVRLLTAAQAAFPNQLFEVYDDETIELYVVVTIVDQNAGVGEMNVEASMNVDPESAAGDELLFLLARHDGDHLEAVHVPAHTLNALSMSADSIARFIDSFE